MAKRPTSRRRGSAYRSREQRLADADQQATNQAPATPRRTARASRKSKKSSGGFPRALIIAPIAIALILVIGGGVTIAVLKSAKPKKIPVVQLNITTENNDDGHLTLSSTEFEIVFEGNTHDGSPITLNPPVDGYSEETPVTLDDIPQPDGNRYIYDQDTRQLTILRDAIRFIYTNHEHAISAQGQTWQTNGIDGGRLHPLRLIVTQAGTITEWTPPPPKPQADPIPDPTLGEDPLTPRPTLTPEEREARRLAKFAKNPIDVNNDVPAELVRIPGIGPAKAEAIYQYREANGKFTRFEDLILVDGIGEATLEEIRPYITLGPDVGSDTDPEPEPPVSE